MKSQFPWQRPGEEIMAIIHRHWVVGIGRVMSLLFSLSLCSGLIYAVWRFADTMSKDFQSMLLLLIVHSFLWVIVSFQRFLVDMYFDVMIVTTERLIDVEQVGLFRRAVSEVALWQVIGAYHNVPWFWADQLGYGDIHVSGEGRDNVYDLSLMADPQKSVEIIMHAVKQAKQKEETSIVEETLRTMKAADQQSGVQKAPESSPESAVAAAAPAPIAAQSAADPFVVDLRQ